MLCAIRVFWKWEVESLNYKGYWVGIVYRTFRAQVILTRYKALVLTLLILLWYLADGPFICWHLCLIEDFWMPHCLIRLNSWNAQLGIYAFGDIKRLIDGTHRWLWAMRIADRESWRFKQLLLMGSGRLNLFRTTITSSATLDHEARRALYVWECEERTSTLRSEQVCSRSRCHLGPPILLRIFLLFYSQKPWGLKTTL